MTLKQHLLERVSQDGPMSVADYMTECLLHPTHGYYVTRDPLGAQGDFTTAPEVSQMFGELIGLSLAQSWQDQGHPEHFTLAELGPGRGTLMADVLRVAQSVPDFRPSLRVHLVETSAPLRAAQRERLPDEELHWHDDIADIPSGPTLLIANEFFDALPIQQLIRAPQGWVERCVGLDPTGALAYADKGEVCSLADEVPGAADAPVGSVAEVSQARTDMAMRSVPPLTGVPAVCARAGAKPPMATAAVAVTPSPVIVARYSRRLIFRSRTAAASPSAHGCSGRSVSIMSDIRSSP